MSNLLERRNIFIIFKSTEEERKNMKKYETQKQCYISITEFIKRNAIIRYLLSNNNRAAQV